jgi:hypothetical protein
MNFSTMASKAQKLSENAVRLMLNKWSKVVIILLTAALTGVSIHILECQANWFLEEILCKICNSCPPPRKNISGGGGVEIILSRNLSFIFYTTVQQQIPLPVFRDVNKLRGIFFPVLFALEEVTNWHNP